LVFLKVPDFEKVARNRKSWGNATEKVAKNRFFRKNTPVALP
jgi:hypothetical protein